METSLRVPSLHPDTVTERAVEESRADSIDCQHVGSPENHRDASTGNKKCSQVYQKDLISASEEGNNSTVAAPSGVSKAMWEVSIHRNISKFLLLYHAKNYWYLTLIRKGASHTIISLLRSVTTVQLQTISRH